MPRLTVKIQGCNSPEKFDQVKECLLDHQQLHRNAPLLFADATVDVIFHDAGHEYGAVEADLRAWLPKLRVGGIWALHDYGWAGGRAVDACQQLRTERLEGALYIGRKIA